MSRDGESNLTATVAQALPGAARFRVVGAFKAGIVARGTVRIAASAIGELSAFEAESDKASSVGEVQKQPARIELPPGVRLASLCRLLLNRRAYNRIVEPQIADMQFEFIEALRQGKPGVA